MSETTEHPTLSEFLLARIGEDKAAVTGRCKAVLSLIKPGKDWPLGPQECEKQAGHRDYHGTLAGYSWVDDSAPSPARVLAECEAKRRIVELEADGDGGYPDGFFDAQHQAMQWLALPYADHADYREEWRP